MKIVLVAFLCLAVSCLTSASPASVDQHSLVRHRRQLEVLQIDFFGNTRKLIEELIQNLNQAATQAQDAFSTFGRGLGEQAKQFRERFEHDLNRLRNRVDDAIQSVTNRFTESGSAIRECITSHRNEAELLLQDALQQTSSCADSRLKEARELLDNVNKISDDMSAFSAQAYNQLRNCTEISDNNILTMGSCLGNAAIQTEMKGAILLTQSGLAVGRLNLYMATLPAALEVCAGTGLVGAGIGTARIVMEIGSCSASSVFLTFTGGSSGITPAITGSAIAPEQVTSSISSASSSVTSGDGAATSISSAATSASNTGSSITNSISATASNTGSSVANSVSGTLSNLNLPSISLF